MTPISYWVAFHVALLALLIAEYGVHRAVPDARRKAIWTLGLWVVAALVLAAVLLPRFRSAGATQFVAGYLMEQTLSVDNLFVFLLLFRVFRIPAERQPKVLFWGVAGAVVLRGAFIAGGLGLLQRFHWIGYVFGAVLLVAAARLLKPGDVAVETDTARVPRWMAWLTRWQPVSESQEHFVVKEGGRWMVTVLLLALVAVELTDVVFALDSIPAVLSITREPFLAYTSNIMAVMGLRSMYVLLAGMMGRLRYLHLGLAGVLAFAGLKMLGERWLEVGPIGSLGVIVGIMGATIGASVMVRREEGGRPGVA